MKRQWMLLAAAAALGWGGAAQAANPFEDVPRDSWAYGAVEALAAQGALAGYPDGAFRGERTLTRYEMAQITARLMAREDRLDAAQRADVARLAEEYADELDALGVRVTRLEKQAGAISWSGDSRMRYKRSTAGDGTWDGRVRITAQVAVNENTTVTGRFTSGNVNWQKDSGGDVKMDRMNVRHDFGGAALVLGRYEIDMGTQATWLAGSAFDGAELYAPLGETASLRVGFGRFKDAAPDDPAGTFDEAEAFYAQAKADFSAVRLGLDFFRTSDFTEYGARRSAQVAGANVTVPLGRFRLFGDYYADTDAPGTPRVWAAGVGYGAVDRKKPGTFGIDAAYYHVEKGVYHQYMTGLDIDDTIFLQDGHFWLATGDVTLLPNLMLHGEWAFAYRPDGAGARDLSDAWELSLVYKF